MRFARHLVQNYLGHFYVRVYVPKDLRTVLKKSEIRRSMKTTCEATAQQRSITYIQAIQTYFRSVRERYGMAINDKDGILKEMVRVGRMTREYPDGIKEIFENVEFDGESEQLFMRNARGGRNDAMNDDVRSQDIDSPAVTEEFQIPQPVLQSAPLPTAITAERPLYSQVVDKLIIEKSTVSKKKRSMNDYRLLRKIFINLYTDQFIDLYDIRIAYDFRDVLKMLPLNVTRTKPWRDMNIRDVLKDERLEDEKKLDRKRVSDLLVKIGAIFNNAVDHNKLKYSIFRNINVDYEVKNFALFTHKELCEIFGKELPVDIKMPSHYWVPLIGLFAGMRRSEIFFRTVADIKDDGGVWFFDVHRLGDSDTKNKGSVRRVPIHSKLIKLGFLDFVEKVRKERGDKARLFIEYSDHGGQAGNKFTDFFGNYLDSIEITARSKVFHSFRTTFINALEALEVQTVKIQRLVGHVTGTVALDTYGGQSDVRVYSDEIEKLNFDNALLDLPRWPY